MRYKVTRQYASGSETLFAEFNDVDDATMFIGKILATDEKGNVKQICRLFDNNAILQNFNPNNIDIKNARAQYADGDCELPSSITDPFNVIVRVTSNSELTLAKFSNLKDAKNFVNAKLHADSNINVDMTYYIFDGDKFLEKCDKNTMDSTADSKEKKKIFRPTPLPNKPRLGPGSYWVDEEDDKDNKK